MTRLGAAAVAVVLAATALLTGCAVPNISAPPLGTPPPSTTATANSAVAEPAGIGIPRIDVTSSLVGLGLAADGSVEVPPVEQPMQAGWFTGSPKPGEPGPAVVLGHVNGGGQAGIFARLHELAEGDEIRIRRTDGTVARFTVTRVDQVPKADFPTEAVYGDTEGPELRLITCGGSFDRAAHSYRDNVIVYAKLA
ncbi:MAG: class F sortase [Actinophytocola sp.]|uniref:class F sortase n=1 Tax=Actinophytocola sp. TaxID=1872138 RepID=UPI003C74F20E